MINSDLMKKVNSQLSECQEEFKRVLPSHFPTDNFLKEMQKAIKKNPKIIDIDKKIAMQLIITKINIQRDLRNINKKIKTIDANEANRIKKEIESAPKEIK